MNMSFLSMNQWNIVARDVEYIRGRLKCCSSVSNKPVFMRKIETQMNSAIRSRKDWHSGNTRVEITEDQTAIVYLHGNKIAVIDEENVQIFDGGGYQTVTTKSRLNAIIEEFIMPAAGVFQKNWNWFVKLSLDFSNIVPFESGIVLN